ncbi:MAG: 5-methyltetrahydrofolate--homocysteine methyltransferase [Alteromonas macleodii]|jgi:5-methyltetrahydrofolate--homocysteine methyltransferase
MMKIIHLRAHHGHAKRNYPLQENFEMSPKQLNVQPNALSELLATRDWLLADGATGTTLFNMGLQSGDAPELWNFEHRDRITALYKGAIDAGSDIFLTNTFGGNASRLKLHNIEDQVYEINKVAAEIARDVADQSGRKVAVAGSVGPTGEIMTPMGALTYSSAVEMFHEQAEGLKAGGADVLWCETISAGEEFKAAAEAFALADMPWCGTMSFDTAGRTMMGLTSAELVKLVKKLPNPPIAFGANCGVGASDLLRTILGFGATVPEQPVIAKGNAGIPKYVEGHIHYDGTPELMADYACLARNSGAKIIGGCCGTTPDHLRAMRAALETRPKEDAPTLDAITAALGGFSSISDGTDGAGPVRGPRRGRIRS